MSSGWGSGTPWSTNQQNANISNGWGQQPSSNTAFTSSTTQSNASSWGHMNASVSTGWGQQPSSNNVFTSSTTQKTTQSLTRIESPKLILFNSQSDSLSTSVDLALIEQVVNFFKLPASYFIREHLNMFILTSRDAYILKELVIMQKLYEYRQLDRNMLYECITRPNSLYNLRKNEKPKLEEINKFKTKYKYSSHATMIEDMNKIISDDHSNHWYSDTITEKLSPQQLIDIYLLECKTYNHEPGSWSRVNIYHVDVPILAAPAVYYSLLSAYDIYNMFVKYTKSKITFEQFNDVFTNIVSTYDFKANDSWLKCELNATYPMLQHLRTTESLYVMSIAYNYNIHDFQFLH